MAKKLYVGNLNYEVTEDELSQLFSQCGQVSGARIVKDKYSGRSKGFGFVEMPNDDEATHAIDRMKGYDLKGRPITVDEAKERPEGVGGGGGRFSGGGGPSPFGGGGNGAPGGFGGAIRAQLRGSSTFDVALHAAITPSILALAIGLAVIGGVLAGAAGGMRAARLRPAESLRSVA